MFNWLKNKKLSKKELDKIFNKATRGLFSPKTVKRAYIEAGLSEEKAIKETEKRLWPLD